MKNKMLEAAALSDTFSVLALLTQYPTADVAEGFASGALQSDLAAVARDLGLGEGALSIAGYGLEGSDAKALLHRMRVDYTALFNHPEHPLVPLYEGQYLFDREEAASAVGYGKAVSSHRDLGGEASAVNGPGPHGREESSKRRSRKRAQAEVADARPRLFVNPACLDALREYRNAGVAPQNERQMPADAMPVEMEFCSLMYLRLSQSLLQGDEAAAEATRRALDEFSRIHLGKWMRSFFQDCAREATCGTYQVMGVFGAAVAQHVLDCQSLAACA